MGKYIIGGIIVILALFSGYYLLKSPGTATPDDGQPTQQPMAIATSTYATTTFSVVYPSNFSVNDQYAYDQFGPKKLIHGVSFTIPMSMATGTNLSSDTHLSVESLPRAKNCTGDIYIQDNVKAQSVTEGGVDYSVASTSGAGAGNFYEEQVFALSASKPCIGVRYFIHSTNIGNYPEGAVTAFDKDALISAFDTIRRSLTLTQ